MMLAKFNRRAGLVFGLLLFMLIVGTYFYKSVLPYQFPNQWRATPETINPTGQYDLSEEMGVFMGRTVKSALTPESTRSQTKVLGDTNPSDKRIEVDLSTQRVYAFEGDNKVMEFIVSTGKWGRTPTGNFKIAYKTKAQKMSGGSKALGTYYYLPNVQFVQFFGNNEIPWSRGFSFHGAYWHDNFGQPMSHGCINMRNEDAEKLFYWTNPDIGGAGTIKVKNENEGTPIYIYGTTPKS